MSTPSFICIGAQKAGTTWLDQQLRYHPEIWMPPMKEIHYFDYVHRPEFRQWIGWHLKSTMRRELLKITSDKSAIDWQRVRYLASIMTDSKKFTDEWYADIFSVAPPGTVTGEITPEYSTLDEQAIAHMRRLCNDPVFIYIIRDPVKRAWSQLKMNMVRNGDFNKAVSKKNKIVDIDLFHHNIKHYSIVDRADYESYIPKWDELKDKVLYVPFQEISTDPNGLLKKVAKFIGVSDVECFTEADKQVHKGSGLKMPKEVASHLSDIMMTQYDYLEKRFGKDFSSNT